MGQLASVIKAISCQDCARYVCNALDLKSSCSDCCALEFHTEKIDVSDSDSDYSVEIIGCCGARSTKY